MRQQELQDDEEKMHKRRELSSSSSIAGPSEIEYCSTAGIYFKLWIYSFWLHYFWLYSSLIFSILSAAPSFASAVEGGEVVTSQETCAAPTTRQPQRMRQNRYTRFRVLIGSNPFSLICGKFCEEFGHQIVMILAIKSSYIYIDKGNPNCRGTVNKFNNLCVHVVLSEVLLLF